MNNNDLIRNYYMDVFNIHNEDTLKELVNASRYVVLEKNTKMFFIGDEFKQFYFCDDACVKGTSFNIDGEKFVEGYIFKRGVPVVEEDPTTGGIGTVCHLVLETIKKSSFVVIDVDKITDIIHRSDEMQKYYIDMLHFSTEIYRLKANIRNLSAIERVEFIQQYYSDVLPYTTNEDAANFLKINTTTYSKIKNKNYKLNHNND